MPHGNRPEKDSRTALEDAADDLRRVSRAIREESAGRLTHVRDREAETLRAFARARGLILDPFDFLAPAWQGGEEHLVWRDDANDRAVKLTKPNCFGLTVEAEWFLDEERDEAELRPALRGAMPLEYLDRLLLQNEVFGDEIELLGIIDKRQAMHVVTAQPVIRGDSTPLEEIARFMESLGFLALPNIGVGREGALSFLLPDGAIAAFDCHPANFLSDGEHVFPIDVLLVRADEQLLTALASAT